MILKIKLSHKIYFTLYYVLLLVLYLFEVKEYYYWRYISFLKDTVYDISTLRLILGFLIFRLNLLFLEKLDKTKFYYAIISIIFILVTIPSLIAFSSANMYPYKLLFFHQLFFFSLYYFSKIKVNLSRIPRFNKNQSLYILLFVIVVGTLPYIMIYGPHINLNNLLLMDVYQTRALMSRLSNPYFGYTYSPFTKIIIPLFIIFSLEAKNYLFTFFGVLFLLLFYLFGAHKTVYLGIVIVFIFYKLSYSNLSVKVLKYSNILIVVSTILALFLVDDLWILIFRRLHFVPTLLDICYLDFFENNYLYWSESIFKSFVKYPYDMNHANVIGEYYFKKSDMGANNGLISDGYMNMGSIGVFVNVILVSIYFMIINNLNVPSRYFGLFFLTLISFISSSMFTVLFTHGGIILLLTVIFFMNEKEP